MSIRKTGLTSQHLSWDFLEFGFLQLVSLGTAAWYLDKTLQLGAKSVSAVVYGRKWLPD